MDLPDDLHHTFLSAAKSICRRKSTPVDDFFLMKLYARFSIEKGRSDKNEIPVIPPMLSIDESVLLSPKGKQYKEVSELFTGKVKDIYGFLRFGVTGVVRDYRQFREAGISLGFKPKTSFSEHLFIVVMDILRSESEDVSELYDKVMFDLSEKKHQENLTMERLNSLRSAMQTYGVRKSDSILTPNYAFKNADKDANSAIRLIKNKLGISSVVDQLDFCKAYFRGCNTVNTLYPRYVEKQRLFNNDYDEQSVKSKIFEVIGRLSGTMPNMVIEAMYSQQKETNGANTSGSIYRNTNSQLECGIVFDCFSRTLNAEESSLIVFPSPFFIRRWAEDPDINRFQTTFIVPSKEEADLWRLTYGTSRYVQSRRNFVFETLDDLLESRGKSEAFKFGRILVFALTYETTGFALKTKYKLVSLSDWLATINRRIDIFCVSSDVSFDDSGTFSGSYVRSYRSISKVLFLDIRTEGGIGIRQNMWIGSNLKEEIPTEFYKSHLGQASRISVDKKPFAVFAMGVFLGSRSKRDILEHANRVSNAKTGTEEPARSKNEKYDDSLPFDFSCDIQFRYTISNSPYIPVKTPRKKRVNAYLRDEPEGKTWIEVPGTRNSKDLLGQEEITEWLDHVYPYSVVETDRNKKKKAADYTENPAEEESTTTVVEKRSIRKEAIKILSARLSKRSISVRTLLYIYPDLFANTDFEEKEIDLIQAFSETEMGKNWKMDLLDEDVILSEFEEGFNGVRAIVLSNLIARVCNLAVGKGHLEDNPFDYEDEDEERNSRALTKLRSALATKTFTMDLARLFRKKVLERISSGDRRYIGVLIKFFTGMESRAIVVLKWEDFRHVDGYNFWQLDVFKHYREPKKEGEDPWVVCEKDTEIRSIPCSRFLSDELIKIRRKAGNPKRSEYIISGTELPLDPKKINEAFRKLFSKMGLGQDEELSLPDDLVDLSRYGGDFLREHFRYVCSDVAGLQSDEIAYLLGTTPLTTFGRYYCDYLNPAAQYMLFTKLCRIDSLIESPLRFRDPQAYTISNNQKMKFVTVDKKYSQEPTSLPMQLNTVYRNDSDQDVRITVSTDHGGLTINAVDRPNGNKEISHG